MEIDHFESQFREHAEFCSAGPLSWSDLTDHAAILLALLYARRGFETGTPPETWVGNLAPHFGERAAYLFAVGAEKAGLRITPPTDA